MRQPPDATPRATVAGLAQPAAGLSRRRQPRARGPLAALLDEVAFFKGFLQHPEQVGSIIPSSGFLARRIIGAARLSTARCVVELGPGLGGTTRAFLQAMRIDAPLLAIELNPAFHARIADGIDDPRLIAQLGSAAQIDEFVSAHRLPRPDAVISGIPFSTMPTEAATNIAQAVATTLAPGGRFVAYQVRAHVATYATPHLGTPELEWEWLNVPPMRVFTWRKPPATG